jgi:hypothetical protein
LPDFDLPLTLPDIVYWVWAVCEGTEGEGQRWWGDKKDVAPAIVVLLKREATKQTKITRLGNHSFGFVAVPSTTSLRRLCSWLVVKE